MDYATEKKIKDALNDQIDTLFEKGQLPHTRRKKPQATGPEVHSKMASNLILCSASVLQLVLTLSPLTLWDIGLATSLTLAVLALSKIDPKNQGPSGKQGAFAM